MAKVWIRYRGVEENFPKHHLQDAGKCMGKKANSFENTENILKRFPQPIKYYIFPINS